MENFNVTGKQIVIDKYLPHNFLAEKMILSCLLITICLPVTLEFSIKYDKN